MSGITVGDVLKALSVKKQMKRFQHKTKYGKKLPERWGYDTTGHTEHYQKIKNTPYDPRIWG
jgi:hypothetical protein